MKLSKIQIIVKEISRFLEYDILEIKNIGFFQRAAYVNYDVAENGAIVVTSLVYGVIHREKYDAMQ